MICSKKPSIKYPELDHNQNSVRLVFMANLMTGAEIVFRALEDQGVKHIFGYPGGRCCQFMMNLKIIKK